VPALLALALALPAGAGVASAQSPAGNLYRVTVQNVANQPWAPVVAATHRSGTHIYQVGGLASDEIATVAQMGNPAPLHAMLSGMPQVTQAVNVGHPIPGRGIQRTVDGATYGDTETFEIRALPGDTLSLAGMLACTNDGFVGLDSVVIPTTGSATYMASGYDAGREENTERSEDLGDPCSVLGATALRGDPNGNNSSATSPAQPIRVHPGVTGSADLSAAAHGWQGAVARVTITRVAGASALPATGRAPAPTLPILAVGLVLAGSAVAALRRRSR
jgi:hypothetical protein